MFLESNIDYEINSFSTKFLKKGVETRGEKKRTRGRKGGLEERKKRLGERKED